LWLERVRRHSMVLDTPAHFYGGSLATLAMKLYKEFRALDRDSPLVVEGLSLEILAEASRRFRLNSASRPPSWLYQVREILHDQFSEHLTLASIAKSAGVHPVHMAREFRKHFRLTIGEYLRQLRIQFACAKLSNSDSALPEIALEAGFSHQSHFSRTFKRLTGMTPAEYRKISRSR
jgi:AraC family transcriptional regulator